MEHLASSIIHSVDTISNAVIYLKLIETFQGFAFVIFFFIIAYVVVRCLQVHETKKEKENEDEI